MRPVFLETVTYVIESWKITLMGAFDTLNILFSSETQHYKLKSRVE